MAARRRRNRRLLAARENVRDGQLISTRPAITTICCGCIEVLQTMRAESQPLYTIAPGWRRTPAPTGLNPPQLVARPVCLGVCLIVILLLGALITAISLELGRGRASFKQP